MKYQTVLQQSEEDCGAACLASILKHYGKTVSLNRIREAIGTGQLGTTLLGLRRGSESLGFRTRGIKASPEILEKLENLPLPAIIHWKGYHWVVLYGQRGKHYIVADPAVGLRKLSAQELLEGWMNGVMLLLEPDPTRSVQDDLTNGIGRFFQPVWTYRAILAEAFVINLVLGLFSFTAPFLIQILTDDVLVRGDSRLLTNVVIAVVVMNAVSSSLRFVQSTLIAHFAQRLELGLVLDFCRQILQLPLTYYESRRSGEIISRLRDIQEINQLVSQVVIGLPSQFFIALVSFSFMVFYSWKLTLVALTIAGLMSLSTIVFLPTLQQKTRSVLVLEAENQGILVETFKGALTLKTTAAAPQFWEELQARFGRLTTLTFRTIQIAIINNTFSGFVSSTGSAVLLWCGSKLVIDQELSIGQLLAFNGMNGNFNSFVVTLISFVNALVQVRTAVQRLTEVIDSKPEDNSIKPFAQIPDDADIVCTNLNYHHAGRVELLKNLSIKIPGGRVVALIGPSGCGKSTLVKVLAGLYPSQSGNIRIGMYNLQDLSLDSLRQQVVLVPQEPHFWSRSIIENFRLSGSSLPFEAIVKACQVTGADEFISQLPDKYQTVLGEFGVNLSGGQRQRLAIARAIVNNPPVLILDESTANLDSLSEAQVLDQLLSYRHGKTTILISHRSQIIDQADCIVSLDQSQTKSEGLDKVGIVD